MELWYQAIHHSLFLSLREFLNHLSPNPKTLAPHDFCEKQQPDYGERPKIASPGMKGCDLSAFVIFCSGWYNQQNNSSPKPGFINCTAQATTCLFSQSLQSINTMRVLSGLQKCGVISKNITNSFFFYYRFLSGWLIMVLFSKTENKFAAHQCAPQALFLPLSFLCQWATYSPKLRYLFSSFLFFFFFLKRRPRETG